MINLLSLSQGADSGAETKHWEWGIWEYKRGGMAYRHIWKLKTLYNNWNNLRKLAKAWRPKQVLPSWLTGSCAVGCDQKLLYVVVILIKILKTWLFSVDYLFRKLFIWVLLCCVLKYHDQKQLTEAGVYFGLQLQRNRVHQCWKKSCKLAHDFHPHTGSAEKTRNRTKPYNLKRWNSSIKIPPHIVPPTEDQVCT